MKGEEAKEGRKESSRAKVIQAREVVTGSQREEVSSGILK